LPQAKLQQTEKQVYILTFMAPTILTDKLFPSPVAQTIGVFATLFACWILVALFALHSGEDARSH